MDIWSNKIEEFRRRSLVFTQTVTMASEYGVGKVRGFQNLNIPTTALLNSGTARQKSESTDITYDANTDNPFTLAIDQHWYQAFNTEEFADALSGFDIECDIAQQEVRRPGHADVEAVDLEQAQDVASPPNSSPMK